ncbi:uncharacterized protein LOC129762914 [Toxorhynchites rutilus septentrionalis]|uniref:uncharacterized protein LOC129762914 n=1 Tax=Toxorhynchites rutilus septentrionalis TaxID=329112 RepID=UPI00247AE4A6|nr:uncharacterized protein LOC129762914 [Toxorhynchites rutilus septentrionalis]
MNASVVTDVVNLQPERDNPILLNFQNAEMSYRKDTAIECYRANDINRVAAEDPAKPSAMALLFTDQLAYQGYPGEGLPDDLMNTFVAVRNRRSGKMRLIQVEQCRMLNACYDDNKNKTAAEPISRFAAIRAFGGKKAIRAIERISQQGFNVDVMDRVLGGTVRNFVEDKAPEDNAFAKKKVEGDLLLASIRPPRNSDAKTALELYQIEQLVSKALLNNLKTVALDMMKREPESIKLISVYLTNKVKAALQCKDPDSRENIRTLSICFIMDALVRLLEQKNRMLDKVTLSPFSKHLDEDIKRNFSQINHHQELRTKYSEHKALLYYLVMAFILEKGVMNVEQIHSGLNISKNDFLKFAAFIGGSYRSADNTLTLKLTSNPMVSKSSFRGSRRSGKKR